MNGSTLGITIEKTVWCSQCGFWEQQDAYRFQDTIKVIGWTRQKRKWLCPDCSSDIEAEKLADELTKTTKEK